MTCTKSYIYTNFYRKEFHKVHRFAVKSEFLSRNSSPKILFFLRCRQHVSPLCFIKSLIYYKIIFKKMLDRLIELY
ncbi:MAG: hypothetical protein BWK80_31175 [Desulfobacteraceae bacterium IS3]|nr:MAG: hypothetical protein BWK80_31175 [Desulfobacteraceae bacterium IS3]